MLRYAETLQKNNEHKIFTLMKKIYFKEMETNLDVSFSYQKDTT